MKLMNLSKAKNALATLWGIFTIILVFIFSFQTLNGIYLDNEKQAWGWLIQGIFPSLSLMIGVFISDSLQHKKSGEQVKRFYFRIAFILSFCYLLLMLFIVLYRPFTVYAPIEILEISSIWIGPIQGIVTAAIGMFFFNN